MLYKLLIKSLSVKVSLNYVISSRVIQKKSKEYQPLTPNLFFQLISFYCVFDGGSKLTSETNQFVKGFGHFLGLFLISNGSLLLSSYVTTRKWHFLPTHMGKNGKVCAVSSEIDFLSKLVKIFYHIFDIAHI